MRLKIGILGAGHLGKIHIKCLKELEDEFEIVGFHDLDPLAAAEVEQQLGIKAFSNYETLIDACDAVDIVTPTTSHYECAMASIKRLKHTFIEKPLVNTIEEARFLVKLSREAAVKVQVGHVERFNPAFQAAVPFIQQPQFIETHRLSAFNPRGTDVSVVLDLMIHDIDIVLAVTGANVRKISASGVAVVSETPDIANARLELDNGCVANLTASRMSLKKMRKSRFFQKDAYISVDFLEHTAEVLRMKEVQGDADPFSVVLDLGAERGRREILFEKPNITPVNAIREELRAFHHCIINDLYPVVPVEAGARALDVALQILEKMRQHVLIQDDSANNSF